MTVITAIKLSEWAKLPEAEQSEQLGSLIRAAAANKSKVVKPAAERFAERMREMGIVE